MFVRTFKNKLYREMTLNGRNSYLRFLDKLVHNYSNTYYHSIGKKPIGAGYFVLPENLEPSNRVIKFSVCDRVTITKYKEIILPMVTVKIG